MEPSFLILPSWEYCDSFAVLALTLAFGYPSATA